MYTYFSIPDIVVEVAHFLDHLHMNPDDQIAIYNIAFLQYSAQLQWTENTLCYRCKGDWSRTLQEIPQLIIVYEICYNLPPEDSSEN